MPLTLCAVLFQGHFWKASWSPNQVQKSSLEILVSLLSRTTWIFWFGVDLPLQKCNLSRVLPVWQKSGREGTFWVFLALLEVQNLSKLLSHVWACINFHDESKNENFSSNGGPHQKHSAGDATHLPENPVFSLEKFKIAIFFSKFHKICHEWSASSIMLGQWSFSQDLELIFLFLAPQSLPQLGF